MIDDPCARCHHENGCPFDDRAERRKDGDDWDLSGSMADYQQARWERER